MNTILFVDIVGSSKSWKKFPAGMKKAIEKHFAAIKKIVKQYNGKIIKTIGDAHMIAFTGNKSLRRAIGFSIEAQHYHSTLSTTAIYVDSRKNYPLQLRIGMAYGKMHPVTSTIQGCTLKDYIGSTVNIASRMESKVANKRGFAFYSETPIDKQLLQALSTIGKVETIIVSKRCLITKNKSKSGKLVNPKCMHPKELKGVGELTAYRVTLGL